MVQPDRFRLPCDALKILQWGSYSCTGSNWHVVSGLSFSFLSPTCRASDTLNFISSTLSFQDRLPFLSSVSEFLVFVCQSAILSTGASTWSGGSYRPVKNKGDNSCAASVYKSTTYDIKTQVRYTEHPTAMFALIFHRFQCPSRWIFIHWYRPSYPCDVQTRKQDS